MRPAHALEKASRAREHAGFMYQKMPPSFSSSEAEV
jgi:hypothetical protein